MSNDPGAKSVYAIVSPEGRNSPVSRGLCKAVALATSILAFRLVVLVPHCFAQEPRKDPGAPEPSVNTTLPVNWIYGSYIPKDAPIVPLTGKERFKLYIRQTYTTPGIYIKTGFFAVHDQVENSPPEGGDDFSGFAKRVGSTQATNIIQNSFTSLGQGVVGWEPRYDRCR